MACIEELLGQFSGLFTTFGVLAASYVALHVLCSMWSGIKAYLLSPGIDFRKLGKWAVVTGATDGIGKAYAHELAKRGMNIVLISRTQEKLEDVAAEIRKKSNVETRIIPINFSAGPEIYGTIDSKTSDLDVGVLVNNVGMSYEFPLMFTEVDEQTKLNLVKVNATSVMMMMHYFLPRMTAKGKGAILNISSASACNPTPLLAVYSATKVYVDFLTRAVQDECKSTGVIIQCVKPYFVATNMSKIRRTNWFVPSPDTYAKAALNTVGVQSSTFGCLSHAVQGFLGNQVLPERLKRYITDSALQGARKKGLKKRQAKKD